MRQIIRRALASIAAILCVGGSVYFARSSETLCPVPRPVLVEWAALGLGGLIIVLLHSKSFSPRWASATWAVCGALLGLAVIGVWSIAPWVLLALLALGAAAQMAEKLTGRKALANLAIVAIVAAVNLALLFPFAKRSGIEVVEVPAGSQAAQIFPTVDYADAYRASLPAGRPHDIESVARVVFASLRPCWTSQAERDRLKAALQNATFLPGRSLGGWTVYAKGPQEIVVGADQPHLDFRVSVFLDEEQGSQRVTVSTVVRYNNWMGQAYFIPVRVGHQIIVPHAVRAAAYKLR